MVWTPPQNGRQMLAKEYLPVDTARQEEKRKTATITEEPSDGLHEEQKHGRYGRRHLWRLGVNGRLLAIQIIYIYIYIYIYIDRLDKREFLTRLRFVQVALNSGRQENKKQLSCQCNPNESDQFESLFLFVIMKKAGN